MDLLTIRLSLPCWDPADGPIFLWYSSALWEMWMIVNVNIDKIERVFDTYNNFEEKLFWWLLNKSMIFVPHPSRIDQAWDLQRSIAQQGYRWKQKGRQLAAAVSHQFGRLVTHLKSLNHGMCGEPVSFWKGTSYKWTRLQDVMVYQNFQFHPSNLEVPEWWFWMVVT